MQTCLFVEPGVPRSVKAWALTSTSLFVNWTAPVITNGKLTEYKVFYGLSESFMSKNETVGPTQTWAVIYDLRPHTNYSVMVQASTAIGGGNHSDIFGPVLTKEDGGCTASCILSRHIFN